MKIAIAGLGTVGAGTLQLLETQADLIGPLTDAGFAVFDRTNPGDPHAGLLSAVRMR